MAEFFELLTPNDFGFLVRGEDEAVCLNEKELCRVIDDAVVYLKTSNEEERNALLLRMSKPLDTFINTPSGQMPALYRAILAMEEFKRSARRSPTLPELVVVLRGVETQIRNRDDDYWATITLVKAIVNPRNLSPDEASYAKGVDAALQSVGAPAPQSAFGTAVLMGGTGVLVGGPVGGVVGFITGFIVGSK